MENGKKKKSYKFFYESASYASVNAIHVLCALYVQSD